MVELNQVGDYKISVLSESDFLFEDKCFRVLAVVGNKSLLVTNTDVKNYDRERSSHRVALFYNYFVYRDFLKKKKIKKTRVAKKLLFAMKLNLLKLKNGVKEFMLKFFLI